MAETMTLTTVLIDISTISTLLFVGFLIRQKIPFFYKYYIPTSLIAGILGLLLGPQVLGQFSPIHLHFSQWISQWTNFLFAFIFTTSFLGTSTGKFGRDVLSTTCVTGAVFMAQVLAGLGIAFLLSKLMSNVPYAMDSFRYPVSMADTVLPVSWAAASLLKAGRTLPVSL